MQKCYFNQSAPKILQKSKNALLNNWDATIGQSSNVSLFISTYFTTLSSQKIILTFPSHFNITPLASYTTDYYSTTINSTLLNYTKLTLINNLTISTSSMMFYASVTNSPFVVSSIDLRLYLICNNTMNQTAFR
jgi:hypothetical protein